MTGAGCRKAGNTRCRLPASLSVILFALLLCLGTAGKLFAEGGPLSGEYWVELEPPMEDNGGKPLSRDEAAKRLLQEAQYVFSGMIYGFTFDYTPSDVQRHVAEVFTLTPVAQIPWGDPALTIAQIRAVSNREYALIRYQPNEGQQSWLDAISSNVFPTSTAIGTGDVFKGYTDKLVAVREAVKEAIRAYLRARIENKPREVKGSVVLADVPYIVINNGMYVAKVTVKLELKEILPYKFY